MTTIKEQIKQTDSEIAVLQDKVLKKGLQDKVTIEWKHYKQPKRELEQNKKIIRAYKRQLTK